MPDRDVKEVLAAADRWLAAKPNDPELWTLRAIALTAAGRSSEAMVAWRKAIELHPDPKKLALSTARLARRQRNENAEMWALEQALSLHPEQEELLIRLFSLQVRHGKLEAAVVTTDRLIAFYPKREAHVLRRAQCLVAMRRFDDAAVELTRLVKSPGPSSAAIDAWAHLHLEQLNRAGDVLASLTERASSSSGLWNVHWWLGKALARLDRPTQAIASFDRAIELAPAEAKIWRDKGVVQRHVGLGEESQASFARSLIIEPDNPTALRLFGYEHKYAHGDRAFRRVTLALARIHRLPEPSQIEVHYAVAKALEDVGELEAAFEHYARAGQLQRALSPWTEHELQRLLAMLKRKYTPELHNNLRLSGFSSNKAVFIIGMPRSGTSLIEQIIARHPQACGAGEIACADQIVDGLKIGNSTIALKDAGQDMGEDNSTPLSERGRRYIETLDRIGGPDVMRVVNKRPGNFTWAGLLDAAIPGSYFIHCRRHPVDTCLSCYRLFFDGEIPYSYDLRDLGRAYRAYRDFMTFWSKLLPADRLLDVRHEDVVDDLKGQIRRILQFIDLPWNDACVNYFEDNRPVRTASALQVRRPIYRRPFGEWRKYEQYIEPLILELGNSISEYEDELRGAP